MEEGNISENKALLTNADGKWILHRTGGTRHESYFNEETRQWLRVHEAYKSGTALQKELKVLRASLAGFEPGRLNELVKEADFDGKPAILSPNLGLTLPFLRQKANQLGMKLPPSFFKQMIQDALGMTEKGVKKTLNPDTQGDDHIVCYKVDGRLRFGFLDPNEDELFPPEQTNTQRLMMEVSIFQLAENYYGYSADKIKNAPDLVPDDLGALIDEIIDFDDRH